MIQTDRYVERLRSHHDALAPLRAFASPVTDFTERLRKMPSNVQPRTIYIHVPFCTHNCTFCNLNRRRAQPPDDYASLILQEIETYATYRYVNEGRYDAVYFGGGTPTTLSTQDLRRILSTLRSRLNLAPDAEVTIETTVADLTEDKITVFQEKGVNRFSIGVQTFSPKGRRLFGRWRSREEVMEKISALLDAGFQDVGIDLIYNWPGQSEEELLEDLEIIESLDLAGLSFYALILMEGTALHRMVNAGQCPPMGDLERERRYFNLILDRLLDQRFTLLEFTKLIKPNRDKYDYVHIRYENGDTLALGAGAGGRLGNLIYHNPSNLAAYRQQVESPLGLPTGGFLVDHRFDLTHRLVGRLQFGRLEWDDLKVFPKLQEHLRPLIEALTTSGLIASDSHGLPLTREGIFWGNNIGQEFATKIIEFFKKEGGGAIDHPGIAHKDATTGHHPVAG